MKLFRQAILLSLLAATAEAFAPRVSPKRAFSRTTSNYASSTSTETSTEQAVSQLKRVLEREYVTMFDPMKTEYYAPDVRFDDPLTSLSGVDAYQGNVDMLGSRTLLGSLLFRDAGIVLHSIEGGEVLEDGTISNIKTRWTLKFTFKGLPWAPTARFSGISDYTVTPGGSEGVLVTTQKDYWDSINLKEGGDYVAVDKGVALQDFIKQLLPGGFQAVPSAPELPYTLLRRGDGYEVRRYPSYAAVSIPYSRRDEGFVSLGSFTQGMSPLSPAIMEVQDSSDKFMQWPLNFAAPGQDVAPEPTEALEKAKDSDASVVTIPSQVVAVAEFADASTEPVVRKADRELREALKRDGLESSPQSNDKVQFAQYDAVFSMGKRRGEIWIPLKDGGHPW